MKSLLSWEKKNESLFEQTFQMIATQSTFNLKLREDTLITKIMSFPRPLVLISPI